MTKSIISHQRPKLVTQNDQLYPIKRFIYGSPHKIPNTNEYFLTIKQKEIKFEAD